MGEVRDPGDWNWRGINVLGKFRINPGKENEVQLADRLHARHFSAGSGAQVTWIEEKEFLDATFIRCDGIRLNVDPAKISHADAETWPAREVNYLRQLGYKEQLIEGGWGMALG